MPTLKTIAFMLVAFVVTNLYGYYWFQQGAIQYHERKIGLTVTSYTVEGGITNFSYRLKFKE